LKTLILCDRGSTDFEGTDLQALVESAAREVGAEVTTIVLNGDKITPCRGCFMCWVKTPGLCIMNGDGVNDIAKLEINSDTIIMLTKITYGGYSFDCKSLLDRSIPNISPFFRIIEGEMHHKARYSKFPTMIAIGYGAVAPNEAQTFIQVTRRNALNLGAKQNHALTIQDADEVFEAVQAVKVLLAGEK